MQVLLCGTNYGSSYVAPLAGHPGGLRLAGVLSRGSRRSRDLAMQAGVAHYTGLDRVPDGAIEAAIVAVPAPAGVELVLELLRRGIPVLAEHPWRPDALGAALDAAAAAGRALHVNSHFSDLEPVADFVARARRADGTPPLFVNAVTGPRTLYSLVEILGRALPALEPFRLQPVAGSDFFAALPGVVGGIPATLVCERRVSRVDDGSATLTSHAILLGFEDGSLLLGESFGPVMWLPRLTHPSTWDGPLWSEHFPLPAAPAAAAAARMRDDANRVALERWAAEIGGAATPPFQQREFLLSVSRAWEAAVQAVGPLEVV